MGCSVKRNSNPWACGPAQVINYLTHTLTQLSPQHTLSLPVFKQTIKSLRQMKAGNSVFVLFCPSLISITKSCHESGRARAYWKMDRLQNAASQSPSMLRFPRWMACQWRVEMGFVWEVGPGCVGPDNGWRADVNSRECIQGSSSGVLESFWNFLLFIYSQALLSPFQLCSAFSPNQFFFLRFVVLFFSCIYEKNTELLCTFGVILHAVDANAVTLAVTSLE